MKTHSQTLALATGLALALGGLFSLHAQDATPAARQHQRGGGEFRGGPGYESLSQEEKDKLKAATDKAQQDPKLQAAREKAEAAQKEFREALQAAQIAADPSVEPIVKKLQEAREKAMKEHAARAAGDQPKQ